MLNILLLAILVMILSLAICYIVKEKKRGATCIGCPIQGGCSGKCNQNSSSK